MHIDDRLVNIEFRKTSCDLIKSSGYVIDSLEAAVWCLLNTEQFDACLLKAVNLGDDSDTVGAIAGGLAGLYYGADAIPQDWLDVLQDVMIEGDKIPLRGFLEGHF